MDNSKTSHMNLNPVRDYLLGLQQAICNQLESLDGKAGFLKDQWQKPAADDSTRQIQQIQGQGKTCVMTGGVVFEKAGVNFSEVNGAELPASATANRPELAGRSYKAMGVSLVIHPDNPYVPTSHMNLRFFIAEKPGETPVWWFGGGFDLTPYYGFDQDCIAWHQTAQKACEPLGSEAYQKYKNWCDEYFYIKHRHEARGIGGIFFDDLNAPDFATALRFMQSVGDHYMQAYAPIVERRKFTPFGEREKAFQKMRRGRYVEFNLVYDRGTLFGLQSGGRVESILMSLPADVAWIYNYQAAPGSEEQKLLDYYLKPKDWAKLNQ